MNIEEFSAVFGMEIWKLADKEGKEIRKAVIYKDQCCFHGIEIDIKSEGRKAILFPHKYFDSFNQGKSILKIIEDAWNMVQKDE